MNKIKDKKLHQRKEKKKKNKKKKRMRKKQKKKKRKLRIKVRRKRKKQIMSRMFRNDILPSESSGNYDDEYDKDEYDAYYEDEEDQSNEATEKIDYEEPILHFEHMDFDDIVTHQFNGVVSGNVE